MSYAETLSHSRGPGNIRVRVRVSFRTEAVRSAILATAGILVQDGGSLRLGFKKILTSCWLTRSGARDASSCQISLK